MEAGLQEWSGLSHSSLSTGDMQARAAVGLPVLLRRGVLASGSCAAAGAGPLLRSAAAKAPEMGLRGEARASGLSCFGFFHVPRQLLRTWTSSTGSALIQSPVSDIRHMLDLSRLCVFSILPASPCKLETSPAGSALIMDTCGRCVFDTVIA